MKATVLYGCGDEELWDLRILAANSVQAVQFPRMAEWLARSFEVSKWAESGLSLTQIFAIAVNDSTRANNARQLTREEVTELKTWVEEKCIKWEKKPGSVYATLRTVENAAPDLVRVVRAQRGGRKDHKAELSPTLLGVIVNAYPGEQFFSLQRAFARATLERKLTQKQTEALLTITRRMVNTQMAEEEVYERIKSVSIGKQVDLALPDDDTDPLSLLEDIQTDLGAEYVPPRSLADFYNTSERSPSSNGNTRKSGGRGNGSSGKGEEGTTEATALQAIITQRELEIAALRQSQDAYWWRHAEYLKPTEQKLLEMIFETAYTMRAIAGIIGQPDSVVVESLQKCFDKRRAYKTKLDRVIDGTTTRL